MSPVEFEELTPFEFQLKLEGFYEFQDSMQRREWERVRWQTARLLQPHAKKGKTISEKDLVVFPWEKEIQTQGQKAKRLSPAEVDELFKDMDKDYLKNLNKSSGKTSGT